MNTPYPDYEDVMRESKEIAENNSTLVAYEEIGLSEEGRTIPCLKITDPAFSDDEKSVFLLSGGTDGNEEVGRAVALGLARALLDPSNKKHLERQVILIVPVTNPDGCVGDLSDRIGNANSVKSNEVHLQGKPPATAEGIAMRALVEEWVPDAHVDFHGLAGGSMGDYSFLYPTVNVNWSRTVLYDVHAEIAKAGTDAGWPMGAARLWTEPRTNFPGWLARNYSSLCMVIEGSENYYPIEDSVASGVARLMRLIEIGEETRGFQIVPNYPCDVVSGTPMGALMSYGETYKERRESRRDMSQMILEGVPQFGRVICDHEWTAKLYLPITDAVKTFPKGVSFQATLDKRATVKEVLWHDHLLEDNLWSQKVTDAGIIIRADVPESPVYGDNYLSINYEVPFKRHVDLRTGKYLKK
ncbi:MAG: hypothetical protein KAI74_02730 [Kiritimatiellae bacterium]|nr:hypothetical protein [Kiritimatiellia bacterium]